MNTCPICNQPVITYNGRSDAPFVGIIEPTKEDEERRVVFSDKSTLGALSSAFYRHRLSLQDLIVFYPSSIHTNNDTYGCWLQNFIQFYKSYQRRGIILFGSLKRDLKLSYPYALTLPKIVLYSVTLEETVITFPSPNVIFTTPGDLEISIIRLKEVLQDG
ncbi:MAG: hypothetical protein ACPLPV_00130 [Methanomassiliicoccales archaeon]